MCISAWPRVDPGFRPNCDHLHVTAKYSTRRVDTLVYAAAQRERVGLLQDLLFG